MKNRWSDRMASARNYLAIGRGLILHTFALRDLFVAAAGGNTAAATALTTPPSLNLTDEEKVFALFQLEQALETWRGQLTLAIPIGGVLITVLSATVGEDIQTHTAAYAFAAAATLSFFRWILMRLGEIMRPVACVIIRLEDMLGHAKADWLVTSFYAGTVGNHYIKRIRDIYSVPSTFEDRMLRIEKLDPPFTISRMKPTINILVSFFIVVGIIQLYPHRLLPLPPRWLPAPWATHATHSSAHLMQSTSASPLTITMHRVRATRH